ncbi:DUF3800 domain-containing protein [Streptomyces sp. NPDC015130]|uniref:DUF3800 domain-containing protein n=1 Tax=Streptomyces sp. NPDC015130 TaxID=3364940 RepID=UPI003701E38D
MNEVPAASPRRLHAFIDEAGVRSHSAKSSDCFVMSAVIVAEADLPEAAAFLAKLRIELGRGQGATLHWQNFKHIDRVHAAKTLGGQQWATISTVVVCKRHLSSSSMDEDQFYLYTLRYLLERLSWFARDSRSVLTFTLAHIVRMKLAKLRAYEAALQVEGTQICWAALDPTGGRMDQPSRVEMLQVADIAASATFAAFNPDKYGNTEPRYLRELRGLLYRRGTGAITSYGMKMHPWGPSTKAAYPWVAAL